MRRVVRGLASLACGLAAQAALATAAAQAFAGAVPISVTSTPVTRQLPSDFVGLALEYGTVPRWMPAGAGDPLLLRLIRNLDPTGRPVIRIGGQSTDRSWWPVPGMARPPGVTYTLTPAWTASMSALARALDARVMLGIDLEAGSTRLIRMEAARLVAGIGRRRLGPLELGNEPTLYTQIPWYRRLNGRVVPWYSHTGTPVYGRGPDWGPALFARQYAQALAALPAGVAVAGPETALGPWMDAFVPLATAGARVTMLTSHAYPLSQCVSAPRLAAYPSVAHLLAPRASRGLTADLKPYVAFAHAHRDAYRLDELGPVSCNGRTGVSDTMASALWLLDSLFSIAAGGIDGVNLHTYPGSVNGLFDLAHTTSGWSAAVHPLYYGALMFARAAPAGSRQLAVAEPAAATGRLRAWATRGRDGRIRLVLINDSLHAGATAIVRAASGASTRATATLERLAAPGAYSRGGLTLGGQGFGAQTTTGTLGPGPVAATVRPRRGAYAVSIPPAQAALLMLSP